MAGYSCSWCGEPGHNVTTCVNKQTGRGFRCLRCKAYRGTVVHHVRGATHCYVPRRAVSYDPKIHHDAKKVVLNRAGYCGQCEIDRKFANVG